MILTCPRCATRYLVEDDQLWTTGRTVQCESCGQRWRSTGTGHAPSPPPPETQPVVERPAEAPVELAELKVEVETPAPLPAPSITEPSPAPEPLAMASAPPATPDPAPVFLPAVVPTDTAPSEVRRDEAEVSPVEPAGESAETLFIAPRGRTARPKARRPVNTTALAALWILVLALAVLAIVAVAKREDIVKAQPALAEVYGAIGLPTPATRSAPR